MKCIASQSSLTYTMKAQESLKKFGIDSDIVRLDPGMTSKGCAYGIEFDCTGIYSTRAYFDAKNITYSDIFRKM